METLVHAIAGHAEHATPEAPEAACAKRDAIDQQISKATKLDKTDAEKQAQAEGLLRILTYEEGIPELQACLAEARRLAGVSPEVDAEVPVAQERLVELRAAAKASAIEGQQAVMEEHAVAALLQGMGHLDKKPCADEDTKKPSVDAEEMTECVVCLDALKSYVLGPCGHRCVCEACAERIQIGDPCPLCRTEVATKFRLYL